MLKRISKQLSFLVAGIPFTERHYSIRIILHAFFFFVVIMCGALLDDAHSEMGERVCWCIVLVLYFNIYYLILQYSLPIMLTLLGGEVLLFIVVYLQPIDSFDDIFSGVIILMITGPMLHVIYMEVLYRLRKELANKD